MRTTFPFSSFAVKGLELIHPVAPDRLYNGELPTILCVSCALAAVPTIPQLNTPAMAPRIDRRPSFQREPARIDSISFHRQLYTPESRLRFASSSPNGQPPVRPATWDWPVESSPSALPDRAALALWRRSWPRRRWSISQYAVAPCRSAAPPILRLHRDRSGSHSEAPFAQSRLESNGLRPHRR